MVIANREIVITQRFLHSLSIIEEYIGQDSERYAKRFATSVFDFIEKVIAPLPEAFPEYSGKPTKRRIYRKAVFKKRYIIIYKVLKTKVEILLIYHGSRNPRSIKM